MNLTRRAFVAAGLGTTLTAASDIRAYAAVMSARMGYIGDFFGASISAVATAKGLWAKEGLDANLKRFTNGPIQVEAIGAGSLDFGYLGPGALWLPAMGRAKVIAINLVGLTDRVIAQAGVTSMADLKGKKVGVPEGTSGDMLLRLALQKAGMSLSDIQVVKMDPSTLVAAFSSRQIDGAGIWYPLVGTIKKQVPNLVELIGNADFYPTTTFPSAFIARNQVIQQNPDLVRSVIRVIKAAADYRAANFDETVEITSTLLGVPAPQLAEEARQGKLLTTAELTALTKDGTVFGWFRTLNGMFKTFGRLDNPLDPKDFYTSDLYLSA